MQVRFAPRSLVSIVLYLVDMEEERLEMRLAIGSLLAILALWLLLPLISPADEPPILSPRAEIISAR